MKRAVDEFHKLYKQNLTLIAISYECFTQNLTLIAISYESFVWNDNEYKILFITWHCQIGFYRHSHVRARMLSHVL